MTTDGRPLDLYDAQAPAPPPVPTEQTAPARENLDLYEGVEGDQQGQKIVPAPGPPAGLSWIGVVWRDFPATIRDRYEPRGVIGEGGMGVVIEAFDRHMQRTVAIKGPRDPASLTPAARDRQSLETRIAARLTHPGILPVYDLWLDARGNPWCSMLRVPGISPTLARQLHELRMVREIAERPLNQLLGTFMALCRAVSFAHHQGIVHRDLKPENVFIGSTGEALVADWGVAAELARARTATSDLVGTPGYAAPEQIGLLGSPRADERADVYSLGMILFEMIVGRRPTDPRTIVAPSRGSTAGRIRTTPGDAPPGQTPASADDRPFSGGGSDPLLSPWIGRASSPVLEIPSRVPRELAAIVSRATAWNPRDRYPSVAALLDAVDTYLLGGLLEGICYSPGERLSKLTRSHPLWVAGGVASVVIALLLALFGFSMQRQCNLLTAQRAEADHYLAKVFVEKAAAALRNEDVDQAVHYSALALAKLPAGKRLLDPTPYTTLARWGPRGRHLWTIPIEHAPARILCVPPRPPDPPGPLGRAPEPFLVTGEADGSVRTRRVDDGSVIRSEAAHHGRVLDLVLAAGRNLAVSAGEDGTIRAFRLPALTPGPVLSPNQGSITALATVPAGKLLASAGRGTLRLWEMPSGRPVPWQVNSRPEAPTAASPFLSAQTIARGGLRMMPDGENLWVAREDGVTELLAIPTSIDRVALPRETRRLRCMATGLTRGPDEAHLFAYVQTDAAGGGSLRESSRTVFLYSLDESRIVGRVTCESPVVTVVFSPGGRFMATGCEDGQIALWETQGHADASRRLLASFSGHKGPVTDLAFSDDEQRLASTGEDRTLRMWDLRLAPDPVPCLGEAVAQLAFTSADRLVVAGRSRRRRVFDPDTGRDLPVTLADERALEQPGRRPSEDDLRALRGTSPAPPACVASPDRDLIATGDGGGVVHVYRRSGPGWRALAHFDFHGAAVQALAFGPAGGTIACGAEDGKIRIHDLALFERAEAWLEAVTPVSPFALSSVCLVPKPLASPESSRPHP